MRYMRERKRMGTATPTCDGCTACCWHYWVVVGDAEASGLRTQIRDGARVLQHNPDGSCVHLIGGTCEVYRDRPKGCREYDCRDMSIAGVLPVRADVAGAVRRWKPEVRTRADARALRDIGVITQRIMTGEGVDAEHAANIAIRVYKP